MFTFLKVSETLMQCRWKYRLFSSGILNGRKDSNSSEHATSQIIETKAIEVLLEHKKQNTWFLSDIDNVLAKTPEQDGSDQWFNWRCAYAKANGETFEKALNHWTAKQLMTDLEPVDEKTVQVIKNLQQAGFPTLAVTSRGMRLGARTVQQLNTIGIDFSQNPIHREEIFWPRGLSQKNDEHVLFEKGILFCSGQDKGLGIRKLFETFVYLPQTIVYIDDHLHQVKSVQKACEKLGVHFFGYHYTYLHPWVEKFDSKAAEIIMHQVFH